MIITTGINGGNPPSTLTPTLPSPPSLVTELDLFLCCGFESGEWRVGRDEWTKEPLGVKE